MKLAFDGQTEMKAQARLPRGIFERVPGSGVYWIHWYDAQGRRHREKVGAKSAAIAPYRKRKTEVLEGRKLPENLRRAPVLFNEIARDALEYSHTYKVPAAYKGDCWTMRIILEWFDGQAAACVTHREIEARFSELARKGRTPATLNHYRALLSLAYQVGIRNGKVRENPARLVPHRREDNARIRFLSSDEERIIRTKIRGLWPDREPEFDLALYTGLRRGEQYRLRWEDVDFERRLLTVPRSKNGAMRHLPLNTGALHALAGLQLRDVHSEFVCGGVKESRYWFEPAVVAAGLKDFTWHCIRHTFASRLVMAGVDIRTVAELMGHKTLAMTMRYAHLAPDHQRAAIDRLEPTATKTATSVTIPPGIVQ